AALLAAAALGGTASGTTATADARAGRLVSFNSCPTLLSYAKEQAGRFVGPWGLAGQGATRGIPYGAVAAQAAPSTAQDSAAAPVEGVDFSGTNVQEQGVDEPDLVKTDGKTLFTIANGNLEAVDVRTAKPRLLDTLKVDPGSQEMLLYGTRLLVISRGG